MVPNMTQRFRLNWAVPQRFRLHCAVPQRFRLNCSVELTDFKTVCEHTVTWV